MTTTVTVTREQVRAARIECQALRSAGLEDEIDPLVERMANATEHRRDADPDEENR
jgi:hypothetical protein